MVVPSRVRNRLQKLSDSQIFEAIGVEASVVASRKRCRREDLISLLQLSNQEVAQNTKLALAPEMLLAEEAVDFIGVSGKGDYLKIWQRICSIRIK